MSIVDYACVHCLTKRETILLPSNDPSFVPLHLRQVLVFAFLLVYFEQAFRHNEFIVVSSNSGGGGREEKENKKT